MQYRYRNEIGGAARHFLSLTEGLVKNRTIGLLLMISDPCETLVDFRAQQCQHLFEVVSMDFLAVDLELDQVKNEKSEIEKISQRNLCFFSV